MTVEFVNEYTADGRIRGSYVYMLLCQLELSPIHIKIGMSSDPFSRLSTLRAACPVEPKVIAVCELASRRKAMLLERDLHFALDRWHTHLEWFKVEPAEKPEFNSRWKPVLLSHSDRSRTLRWNQYSVPEIIKQRQKRLQMVRKRFKLGGEGYRAFLRQNSRRES